MPLKKLDAEISGLQKIRWPGESMWNSEKAWFILPHRAPIQQLKKLEIGAKNVPPGCGGEVDSMSPL